jgi:hypothetical protein
MMMDIKFNGCSWKGGREEEERGGGILSIIVRLIPWGQNHRESFACKVFTLKFVEHFHISIKVFVKLFDCHLPHLEGTVV